MRYNLLKFGHNKLIKHFISFKLILLFSLINNFAIAEERLLYISKLYKSHSLTQYVLKTAYQRLNIKVEFIYLPAERSLRSANEGSIDGEGSRTEGLEQLYPNLLRVKVPIETIALSVYTKNKSFNVQGWNSLKPYHIAYLRGVKVIEKNLIGFNTETVTDIKQAFMMLEHDRVDVIIADDTQALNIMSVYKDIKKLNPAVYTFPVFHYLNKKHANLIPELEVVLYEMSHDGTINRLIQELK
ncbi:hypothetical protein BAC3_02148 [uncultured bacterium]|nr:hypothetical protein BAC3_02148 [uncultured bacterium]